MKKCKSKLNKFIVESELTSTETDLENCTPLCSQESLYKTAITSQQRDPNNNRNATPVLDVRSCL